MHETPLHILTSRDTDDHRDNIACLDYKMGIDSYSSSHPLSVGLSSPQQNVASESMSSNNANTQASAKRSRPRRRKPKKAQNSNNSGTVWPTGSSSAQTSSAPNLTSVEVPAPELSHIDAFFAEYPNYSFDPMQPIMPQFRSLARLMKFDDEEFKEVKDDFRGAMVLDFNDVFGEDENDLESWQRLCRMLEVSPIPTDIDSCHKELRKIHVNIVELLEAAMTGETPKRFPTVKSLALHTAEYGNYFPINDPRAGGVLRGLLRRLLRKKPQRPRIGFPPTIY